LKSPVLVLSGRYRDIQTNMFVCLFVQTLRNYEELPGECPQQFEIARLSALGKIS